MHPVGLCCADQQSTHIRAIRLAWSIESRCTLVALDGILFTSRDVVTIRVGWASNDNVSTVVDDTLRQQLSAHSISAPIKSELVV